MIIYLMVNISRKKIVVIIFLVSFFAAIDFLAFFYPTNEWNNTLFWPDGFLHSVRSISYKGNDFNDTHGLNLEYLSTAEGFPVSGAQDGILPGFESPWKAWTDWTSYGFQIGKDEKITEGMELFTWFSAFRVYVPQGFEGYYDLCLGSDDSIKVWKDGNLIWSHNLVDERRIIADSDIIQNVYLHSGPNVFVVGLYQKTGITGFCFNIKNQDGAVMPWLGFYYLIHIPPKTYGWEITIISIIIIAAFIWVYVFY